MAANKQEIIRVTEEEAERVQALRQKVLDLDRQISDAQQNKRDVSLKLAQMDAEIESEYRAAVDEVAVSDAVDGPGALNRILISKAFQPN